MAVDPRELNYRLAKQLNTGTLRYYSTFFGYVGACLNDEDNQILKDKIDSVCKKFNDVTGNNPDFTDIEKRAFNMILKGKKQKLRTTKGVRWITPDEIDNDLQRIKLWCDDKLREVQRSIRFTTSNINENI